MKSNGCKMTVKNYEEIIENIKNHKFNIPIQIDTTDHLKFICPICKETLDILKVETYRFNGDDCTEIIVACVQCKLKGHRKFYWNKK